MSIARISRLLSASAADMAKGDYRRTDEQVTDALGVWPDEPKARTLSVWDAVDKLSVCLPYEPRRPVERPQPVNRTATTQLNASLWPDCPLCSRDVNHCECDPDAYADAILAARDTPHA